MPLSEDMTAIGRITWNRGDAWRRSGSRAPFAFYYGYFSARAETV